MPNSHTRHIGFLPMSASLLGGGFGNYRRAREGKQDANGGHWARRYLSYA
jgi:hypothetical protein